MTEDKQPANDGNGALEILTQYFQEYDDDFYAKEQDRLLTYLWIHGYKIVPIEETDD